MNRFSRPQKGRSCPLAFEYSCWFRFPEEPTLTALKRLFWSFLANTPLLIGCNFLAMSAILYLEFLMRLIEKNSLEMTSALALRLFPSNIHWILSLTFPMAIGYGLIIATALRDLSDPQARESHVRRWLLLSLLAGPLYFLHVNLVKVPDVAPHPHLRHFGLAVPFAKGYFMTFIWGMVQLEKRLDADGYSAFLAWTHITLFLLAALAGGTWILLPRTDRNVMKLTSC